VQLPELPFFYSRTQPDASWGTQQMVDLLVSTGRHMTGAMPNASPFVVGDISRRNGGPLSGHLSHRGGIDADVGIYKKGAWQSPHMFVDLTPSTLDVEATWLMIRTMLDTGLVDFILLDHGHIAAIRSYVLRSGLLTEAEANRIFVADGSRDAWSLRGVVRHAPNHRDHLHVRVLCGDGTRAG
jgi:murein endopeptidase